MKYETFPNSPKLPPKVNRSITLTFKDYRYQLSTHPELDLEIFSINLLPKEATNCKVHAEEDQLEELQSEEP